MKKIFAILTACIVGFSTVACGNSNAVAKVNGEKITVPQYEEQLKFTKWITTLRYGDNAWEMMKAQDPNYQENVKNQVLDQLIRETELLQYAKKNDVKPDEKQLKEFKEQNKKLFADKKTKEKFDQSGLTEKYMDEYAEKSAIMEGLRKFLLKKSEPSEKQLKEAFAKDSKKVDASHILISTVDQKTGKPMDEKVKVEAKKKAEEVLAKVKAGGDFAKLAKEYSQDPGSKENGGSLGEFGKGKMVPEFEKAAFSLKAGEVSNLVESQFGYHIIKVNKIVDEKFENVVPTLKQELIQKNMQELIQKIEKDAKVEKFEKKLKEIPFGPNTSEKKDDKKDDKKVDKKDDKKTEKKDDKK